MSFLGEEQLGKEKQLLVKNDTTQMKDVNIDFLEIWDCFQTDEHDRDHI